MVHTPVDRAKMIRHCMMVETTFFLAHQARHRKSPERGHEHHQGQPPPPPTPVSAELSFPGGFLRSKQLSPEARPRNVRNDVRIIMIANIETIFTFN